MELNITKYNILQLSKKHNKSQFTYTMNGVPLTTVKEHHYLGILLNYLGAHTYVDQTCNKANHPL